MTQFTCGSCCPSSLRHGSVAKSPKEEFRPLIASFVERRRTPVRDRVAIAVRDGELPSTIEPDLIVAMLSGPLFYRRFITRQPVSPRVTDAVVSTVLAGLRS